MDKNDGSRSSIILSKAMKTGGEKILLSFSWTNVASSFMCIWLHFATVFGAMHPFGMAYFAATFTQKSWFMNLCALLTGFILTGGDKIWLYIPAVCTLTAVLALCDTAHKSVYIKSICTAAVFGLMAIVRCIISGASAFDIAAAVLETFVAGAGVYVLHFGVRVYTFNSKRSFISTKEALCTYVTLALALITLRHFPSVHGLEPACVASILVIYTVCLSATTSDALIIAIVIGACAALVSPSDRASMGSFALGALCGSFLKQYGKAGVVLGFVIANTAESLFMDGAKQVSMLLYSSLCAGLIFALMPKKLCGYIGSISQKCHAGTQSKKSPHGRQSTKRLVAMANSFDELSEIYEKTYTHSPTYGNACAEPDEKDKMWLLKIAESKKLVSGQLRAIAKSVRDECEYIEADNDSATENALWSELDVCGLQPSDVSVNIIKNGDFDINVVYPPEKFDKSTSELTAQCIEKVCKYGAEYAGAKKENNLVVLSYIPRVGYRADFGYAAIAKSGEKVSGDSFDVIYRGKHKMVMVLSDGMGSGNKAAAESRISVELLKKFLVSGFDTDTAIGLINSSLLLKGTRDSFATLDICDIDLNRADLTFTKLGAATAYIKTDSRVTTVKAKSLPAGIVGEADAEKHLLPFRSDTAVVLMSDGITDIELKNPQLEGWIQKELKSINSSNPQIIAAKLLDKARKLCGNNIRDDMSVVVSYITSLKE